jgi:hypothetical protein
MALLARAVLCLVKADYSPFIHLVLIYVTFSLNAVIQVESLSNLGLQV